MAVSLTVSQTAADQVQVQEEKGGERERESTSMCTFGAERAAPVAVSGCASWFEDLHKYIY